MIFTEFEFEHIILAEFEFKHLIFSELWATEFQRHYMTFSGIAITAIVTGDTT